MGDLESARDAFEKTLAVEANSLEALRGLAGIALQLGATEEALKLHRDLLKAGHRTPELLYNTALLLQKSEKHEEAAKLYREALEVSPEFPEALLNLGIALKALGDEEDARSHWRKALKAKPELASG